MNEKYKSFVKYITSPNAPRHKKTEVILDAAKKFNLNKERKVYYNEYFSVRFCTSKSLSNSFSNTVLALSALQRYDEKPFFVVLVREQADNLILLANSTFLKKISHSSQELSMSNIRGSFNGSDIMHTYEDLQNTPENFEKLFTIHKATKWETNLARLVKATSEIKPVGKKFIPTPEQYNNIINSIKRTSDFIQSAEFNILETELNERCKQHYTEILNISKIDNTNIRGRKIETTITSISTKNGLGDYYRKFDNTHTYTDIKTHIQKFSSNPKAYNLDKFLEQMADPKSIFFLFFIGITENSSIKTLLCPAYNKKLLSNTIIQYHWAGRNSRGVAQFNGKAIEEMLNDPDFKNEIDLKQAQIFLKNLLK